MSDSTDKYLKLVGVPQGEWTRAARLATLHIREYPKRPDGVRWGVVYTREQFSTLYIYTTKAAVVVKWMGK